MIQATGGTVREAVAVMANEAALEAAVTELREAGFELGDLSLLAAEEAVRTKLQRQFAAVEEFEDEPQAPRTAFVSREEIEAREMTVGSSLVIMPTLLEAGSVVASAGPVAAAIAGTSMAGALLGTVLTHFLDRRHATWLADQVEHGGILLWVRTREPEAETKALTILRHHAAHDIHVHEIPAPPP